jgi:hypothetical protein
MAEDVPRFAGDALRFVVEGLSMADESLGIGLNLESIDFVTSRLNRYGRGISANFLEVWQDLLSNAAPLHQIVDVVQSP